MRLPELYINEMKSLLGDEYSEYEKSFEQSASAGIRVNTSKISCDDFEKVFPYKINRVPYTKDGYYVDNTDAVSKHPYYFAGLYYIQEPSAMLPAACACPDHSSRVLDLCAAPGGKSTEILSTDPAFLLSNDISYSRTIPLIKNLDLFGSGSIMVSCESPEKLSLTYPEYFDIVLVDAPCSGEGMFRKDPSLIRDWEEKGPDYYCEIQIDILRNAAKMLRPGGRIIYSTCTFSKKEDEMVICKLLKEDPQLSLQELPRYPGFASGFELCDDIDLSKCIRLFPHKINGEGHFVACIRKNIVDDEMGNKLHLTGNKKLNNYFPQDKLPASVSDFLCHVNKDKLSNHFLIANDCVYMLSDEAYAAYDKNVHYSRTGVLVGNLKNGKNFTAHNSMALYLSEGDFDNVLSFDANDENVIKYLKGETLIYEPSLGKINKGYVLMCVDNFPLGFAKFDGNKFKNLYTPGWRYNGN